MNGDFRFLLSDVNVASFWHIEDWKVGTQLKLIELFFLFNLFKVFMNFNTEFNSDFFFNSFYPSEEQNKEDSRLEEASSHEWGWNPPTTGDTQDSHSLQEGNTIGLLSSFFPNDHIEWSPGLVGSSVSLQKKREITQISDAPEKTELKSHTEPTHSRRRVKAPRHSQSKINKQQEQNSTVQVIQELVNGKMKIKGVDVDPEKVTVRDLKKALGEQLNLSEKEYLRIICNSKPLEDDDKKLSSFNINEDSKMHVVILGKR